MAYTTQGAHVLSYSTSVVRHMQLFHWRYQFFWHFTFLPVTSLPEGSWIPPGGPDPVNPHWGSLATAVMFLRSPHDSPSSLLCRVNTSRLSRQNTRVMVPVVSSSTGAALPVCIMQYHNVEQAYIWNNSHNITALMSSVSMLVEVYPDVLYSWALTKRTICTTEWISGAFFSSSTCTCISSNHCRN